MKKIRISGLVVLFLTLAVSFGFAQSGRKYTVSDWAISFPFGKKTDYNNILVTRVIDGDTLKLENGEKVRLIGIDTPEMHESGKLLRDSQRSHQDAEVIKKLGLRSYEFTRGLVQGKKVRLEFDIEKKDKYGRLLAYVFLMDGTFINAEIIRQGFASQMTIPPNVKYADTFRQLYRDARENNLGLWK